MVERVGGVVGGRQTHNLKCHAVGITLSPALLALWGDKHTSTNERRVHPSMADEFVFLKYSVDRRVKTNRKNMRKHKAKTKEEDMCLQECQTLKIQLFIRLFVEKTSHGLKDKIKQTRFSFC